jgi:hypothetical protein
MHAQRRDDPNIVALDFRGREKEHAKKVVACMQDAEALPCLGLNYPKYDTSGTSKTLNISVTCCTVAGSNCRLEGTKVMQTHLRRWFNRFSR